MILDLRKHKSDYFGQFTKNGVIIDTCVLRVLIDGTIQSQFRKKTPNDFNYLLDFLELIKMKNQWSKFFITPHILTETCRYFRDEYKDWANFHELVALIIPILDSMGESNEIKKAEVLNSIDFVKPIIEIGDISICLMANDFVKNNKKIAFLSIDGGLNGKYAADKNVLAMDFRQNIFNYIG
ncbi:hypothetical protein C5B42_01650 [Candidatus Cerribacteria bacterium 'Amazon FNV 2010 28 9']|uniref:PIN domain-containing protein n=1 Tax=Candidatus Cerribacteria bacterium 'Amazon FNV 2010 28 9' TaxID=2081795 RepID=A0A317JQW6_9BACT|nr:MAG: hypothetical protein C5B42_01650 [Candidatus Cerribacteria bacterium 'Amazon FNV 2010 28 9']